MTLSESLNLAACMGHLAVAFLVLARGKKNAISIPVALLCVNFFLWNFATWAHEMSGETLWLWLDRSLSPLALPLALHVTMRFVRSPQVYRPVLLSFYLLFGALALSSTLAFFAPFGRTWVQSSAWQMTYLAGLGAMMFISLGLLTRHLKETTNRDEEIRTRLFLAALVLGGALGSTELWSGLLGERVLGELGTMPFGAREFGALAATSLIALVVLRFRLFGRDLSASVPLYALLLATLATLGYFSAFQVLGPNKALLVVTLSSVTLFVLVATWDILTRVVSARERKRQLVSLGRFSAQMAHDLKNPLAAMKGSLQFLLEEHAQGRSLDEHAEFLTLTVEQVERMEKVIDRYARLSRIEPILTPTDINARVRELIELMGLHLQDEESKVSFDTRLSADIPAWPMDPDLIQGALENVVQNSIKAMPDGGKLSITTQASQGEFATLTIRLRDSGVGMDARHIQRVFDDFYTTREDGSGLGLAFVRRVVEAHGGDVHLKSAIAEGTLVTINLPYMHPPSLLSK